MDAPPGRPDTREEAFRRLYGEHFDAILGFALRRLDRSEEAADAVSETFIVAWRRFAHVPDGPAARLWLYAVARRVLANQRRGDRRRVALGDRLREQLPAAVRDHAEEVATRTAVDAALDRLSGRDQEILRLHLWEGLESREIAEVLGLTTVVVRPRLSRARTRLREALGNDVVSAGHHPSNNVRTLTPKEGTR